MSRCPCLKLSLGFWLLEYLHVNGPIVVSDELCVVVKYCRDMVGHELAVYEFDQQTCLSDGTVPIAAKMDGTKRSKFVDSQTSTTIVLKHHQDKKQTTYPTQTSFTISELRSAIFVFCYCTDTPNDGDGFAK